MLYGLCAVRVAAVKVPPLCRKRLHAWIRAGWQGKRDLRPVRLQRRQLRVPGVGTDRSRQKLLQSHAFVVQRPKHQVVADVVKRSPVHWYDAVKL